MERKDTILSSSFNDTEYKKLLELDPIEQRIAYYKDTKSLDINGIVIKMTETDNNISYVIYNKNVFYNAKLYTKAIGLRGISYNKITKKITKWGNLSGDAIPANAILAFIKYFNIDWFNQTHVKYITKTTLEDILNGKITNEKLLIKKWCSVSLKYKLPQQTVKKFFEINVNDKSLLTKIIKYTENPIATLNYIIKINNHNHINILNDTLDDCRILNIKINGKWSTKRLTAFHGGTTKTISKLMSKMNGIKEIPLYDPTIKLITPPQINCQLLNSELDFWNESENMKNCIYTIYFEIAERGNYFILSANDNNNNKKFTVGISHPDNNPPQINQIYGPHNTTVEEKYHTLFKEWIKIPHVITFFNQQRNYIKTKISPF